jgi:hypothetical protein
LLSAVATFPTAAEEYFVALVNQARANPAATAQSFGIDLNEGLPVGTIASTPKAPIAVSPVLVTAARNHDAWMFSHQTFSVDEAGVGIAQQLTNAGYVLNPAGYTATEDIVSYLSSPNVTPDVTAIQNEFKRLFLDANHADRGERKSLLDPNWQEMGIGVEDGKFLQSAINYNANFSTLDFVKNGTLYLSGIVYRDTNKNSKFDAGEGLGGITITAVRKSDQKTFTTTTWAAGGYSLALPAGTYTVTASGGTFGSAVSVSNIIISKNNVMQDFTPSATAGASASGTVFNDANADGVKQSTETGILGRTVYIDTNKNGKLDTGEPTATTDATGAFKLTGLAAGTYRVRQLLPAGWRATAPAAGLFDITLVAAGATSGLTFGATQRVAIRGLVFNDVNKNKLADPGESPLAGWQIFLDTNKNGILDSGEQTVNSDVNGNWSFNNLAAGTYTVRIVPLAGWVSTTPAAGVFTITLAAGQVALSEQFGEF